MEEEDDKYSLGADYTAEAAYGDLSTGRQSVIDMGRLMAELTIPSVFPPDGYNTGDDLPGNNQSISAMALNTLSSALTFMAFPPGQPILRLAPIEYKLQADVDADPQLYANTLLGLSRLELAHRVKLQTTNLQTAYLGYIKALLVTGNCLWKHVKLREPTFYLPDVYVVQRNQAGMPLLTIHKESITVSTMTKAHREQVMEVLKDKTNGNALKVERETAVDVYSVCKLKTSDDGEQTWCYWQEYAGKNLVDTEVETDFDNPPMWPGWLIPVFGKNWGRGYCEEYRGDLYTLEAHASSINDGAALAALSLLFVKPGQTSIKQVREARNLSTLPGSADDLSVFNTQGKTSDYSFVVQNLEAVARRVGAAFLMQSSIQRSGERVTAEEIRRLGQELDKAMGGLYTQIAQGNQKVVITRAVNLNEEDSPDLPPIPRDVVEVQIITGVDAMGQNLEADSLEEYAIKGTQAFPQSFEKVHDPINYFTRLAAAKGIKPDGLVRKPEELKATQEQEQQAAAQQTLLDKGAGPAIKGMADYMTQQDGGASAPVPN